MGHDEAIIFEKTYGVLTPDLHQMCDDMLNGKYEGYTIEERKKLKSALDTIACEIQNLSDSL